MKSVELFVGVGGLAIGTSNAGFRHEAVIDWDKYACDTVRENQARGLKPVAYWPLLETDVRDVNFFEIAENVDLVAAGPPCQPFSLGGKHCGHLDPRDMFPEAIRAVRQLRPRAVLFENVKGLTRTAFSNYLEYICLQLTFPDIVSSEDETWTEHLAHLRHYRENGLDDGLRYNVTVRVLNAANYGVPQRRERVFIVGLRSDLGLEWDVPSPTHTSEALIWSQSVSGDYWHRHGISAPQPPKKLRGSINRLRDTMMPPPGKPWLTVRDALRDLPDPETDPRAAEIPNHQFMPGARSYPGHTGSPLDEPAKTLKAGDHGVPGGENMMRRPDGTVRYFSVRESARLQTFPDNFMFHGSWTETMRQLGNAVPVTLAQVVAASIRDYLRKSDEANSALQPVRQTQSRGQRREGPAQSDCGALAAQ